jgi:hypothetical protein
VGHVRVCVIFQVCLYVSLRFPQEDAAPSRFVIFDSRGPLAVLFGRLVYARVVGWVRPAIWYGMIVRGRFSHTPRCHCTL